MDNDHFRQWSFKTAQWSADCRDIAAEGRRRALSRQRGGYAAA
jgi:hypothetical protein